MQTDLENEVNYPDRFHVATVERARHLLETNRKVAIVCHKGPDGDAVGSSLCLARVLRAMGKQVNVVVPDMMPENISFLPGYHSIVIGSAQPERAFKTFATADLICMLDFNDIRRIDRLAPMVEESSARRLVIDHHLNPDIEADLVVSQPHRSSTCSLLYDLLMALGYEDLIDTDAAVCCCTGMMTDTHNFAFNANNPEDYLILARIVGKGVDKNKLYERLFEVESEGRIRILGFAGYARMEVLREHGGAITALSREDLDAFNDQRCDTEALVNRPLNIPGIVYSIYLREDAKDFVKVSMRSRGAFSVKDICQNYFGGGGHVNAAGGEFHGSLSEALDYLYGLLPEFDRMLHEIDTN